MTDRLHGMARLVVRNEDELNLALDRAIYLAGCSKRGDEESELAEINAAVKIYEESLAVSTAAGRSARKTSDDVPDGDGTG